jgi:hypothetical protein
MQYDVTRNIVDFFFWFFENVIKFIGKLDYL